MLRLARYLKDFKKEVIGGPICKLMEAVFELLIPLVMASIIDVGVADGDKNYVYRMGGLMLLLGAVGLIFALICQYSAARASQGVSTNLRNDLFAHIQELSHAEIDRLGTNSLITRITNDVNQMQLAVAMLIRLVVRAPFIVIGSMVMAMFIDLKMSVIFVLIIPIVTLVLYLVMSRSIPYYRVRQKNLDEVSLVTRENLEGTRVIRAFSRQEKENRRFEEASREVTHTAVTVGKISAVLNPATFAILNAGIIAIIWTGAMQVEIGALTQGEIVALVSYMTQISLTLIVVANLVVLFTKASASARRINEIFDTQTSVHEGSQEHSENVAADKSAVPKIEFRDVSFSYAGSEEYSLEHIDFKIERGQTIGIIGGTGAGKSTFVNLIPRFYDVTEGEILVDGIPVKEYSFTALRQQFGIVPQNAVLFNGTIMENMRWRKEDATEAEIYKALELAQAKDIVEGKEEKLNTHIVQGGKNLSGGQRQRLTIARALTGDPEIVILDDSASALDYATDARLRQALHKMGEKVTVLIVSQRVSSIKQADHILVLRDGQIAGTGSHDDLIRSCEEYKEICLSQLSEKEVYGA